MNENEVGMQRGHDSEEAGVEVIAKAVAEDDTKNTTVVADAAAVVIGGAGAPVAVVTGGLGVGAKIEVMGPRLLAAVGEIEIGVHPALGLWVSIVVEGQVLDADVMIPGIAVETEVVIVTGIVEKKIGVEVVVDLGVAGVIPPEIAAIAQKTEEDAKMSLLLMGTDEENHAI